MLSRIVLHVLWLRILKTANLLHLLVHNLLLNTCLQQKFYIFRWFEWENRVSTSMVMVVGDWWCFICLQVSEIPKLTSGCTEFVESGEQILEKRKMNQTLLANHSTLLDLLEIPQLMDTYVLAKFICHSFGWSHRMRHLANHLKCMSGCMSFRWLICSLAMWA